MSEKDNKQNQLNEINTNLFKLRPVASESTTSSVFKTKGIYREAFGSFYRNKFAMSGLIAFVALILVAICIIPFAMDPYAISDNTLQAPNSTYWFGTDEFGRDLWSRVWFGVLISTALSIIASFINIVIATGIGLVSGYFESADKAFNWIMKVVFAIPTILILVVFSTVSNTPTYGIIILGMIVTSWASASQQVRAQTMRIKNLDFVTASITLKTNKLKLMKIFFVYNIPTIVTQFSILFPRMILLESTLGFLGLSVPDAPLLGSIISDGRAYLTTLPNISLIPIGFLTWLVGSFQMVSFGLEDAFSGR